MNFIFQQQYIFQRHFSFRKTYFENKYTGNSQFFSQKSHVIIDPLEGVGSMKYGLLKKIKIKIRAKHHIQQIDTFQTIKVVQIKISTFIFRFRTRSNLSFCSPSTSYYNSFYYLQQIQNSKNRTQIVFRFPGTSFILEPV